jgi:hypothetical protein
MIDISVLNEADLLDECPYISILDKQGFDIDTLGSSLSLSLQGYGPFNSSRMGQHGRGLGKIKIRPRDYWLELKREFYILLCTKDRKYSAIRSQFKKKSSGATTTIVGMISATMASQLGAAVGIMTPLVALLLYSALKVGVNSWCNLCEEEFQPNQSKKRKHKDVEQANQGDGE